jgi:hypothetical protein
MKKEKKKKSTVYMPIYAAILVSVSNHPRGGNEPPNEKRRPSSLPFLFLF